MKLGFSIAFLAVLVTLGFCIYLVARSKKIIKASLIKLMACLIVTNICNLLLIIADNRSFYNAVTSVFYISIDWTIFFLFDFSLFYTNSKINHKPFRITLSVFFLIDSINLLLNNIFLHCFDCKNFSGSFETFSVIPFTPYFIHVFFCYLILGLTFMILLLKAISSAYLYKIKYVYSIAAILFSVFIDAIYLCFDRSINIYVLGFSLTALGLYYYSIIYTPQAVLVNSLALVVENMNDPVIFFDDNNECIFKNQAFLDYVKKYEDLGLNPKGPFIEWKENKQYKNKKFNELTEQKFTEEVSKNNITYYFNIWFRCIHDNKNRLLGTFFQIHDKTDEEQLNQLQHFLYTHDRLTKIYNKDTFFEKVDDYLKYNQNEKLIMVVSDIENFKIINDVFGKEMGNKILEKIGDIIRLNKASEDICGRISSDRFACLVRKETFNLDSYINSNNEFKDFTKNSHFPIIIKFGIYDVEDNSMTATSMVDRAIIALNTIRGNAIQISSTYDESMRETLLYEQKLVNDFDDAIKNRQFMIYLQPQINKDGTCNGAEALARWIHPTEGEIHPTKFIQLFEKNGIITELDKYIWDLACMQLAEWKSKGLNDYYISVNISPKDLCFINIYDYFTNLIRIYDINPKNLHLEITESQILMNIKSQIQLIDKLRTEGFIIEMDDFGSGYSSLNLLKNIVFDVLKVDMEFLQKATDEIRSKQILCSIVALGKELKTPIVIEGVETEEQLSYLNKIGCDVYQGFYFDKPLTINDFERKYINK